MEALHGKRKRQELRALSKKEDGTMILAFSEKLDYCSNNMGEIHAALVGLNYSSTLGLDNVILEMDSNIIVDMINGAHKPSWKLQHWIEKIQDCLRKVQDTTIHCFREANLQTYYLRKDP